MEMSETIQDWHTDFLQRYVDCENAKADELLAEWNAKIAAQK